MEQLRPVFAGRKVMLTGGPLAALTGTCRRMRELGAERPFLLATGVGTGEVPGADEAEWCVVELRAPDVLAEIRAAMKLLRLLPAEVADALDRWDPERRALVLSPMFNELPEIAGRRVYGPRRPEWRRLEDKVVVDQLWDDLGVTRAPSAVVTAEPEALRAAAGRLDRGAGTAWAGDARQGFNGGAQLLRWVREFARSGRSVVLRGGAVPGRALRPGPGDAVPGGHPLQHPRDGVPGRGGRVPAGRDGHPAPARVEPAAVRGSGHLLGPARRRPGRDARPGSPGRGRAARTGRLPGGVHRRRGPDRRRVPAHRAQPAPRRRPVGDDQGPARAAGPPAGPCPDRGRGAGLPRRRPGAPGAGDRRPVPGRRRLDGDPEGARGHRGQRGGGGGVRGRRLPGRRGRAAAGRDAHLRALGGWRVRAPEPGPGTGGGRPVAPLAVAAFALADERFGTGIGPLEPARPVR